MIITCTNCSMRLQVDDGKVPARPFTLRCPKCQSLVHAQPPAVDAAHEPSAVAVGQSPASGHPRLDTHTHAPPFRLDSSADKDAAVQPSKETGSESKELLRLLGALLQQGTQGSAKWEARRVLVCVEEPYRGVLAGALAETDYQVYAAENKAQAVERMHDERMDIILLSPEFDTAEQGAAFITREVNSLRPTERRRLFFVHMTDTGRTHDAHAAFVNNVNLIINREDIGKTPRVLERSLRDYNDLYRNFNNAMGVSPL